jgi:hypothetical protein
MKINSNINLVKTSATLEINEKSKFLQKKGKKIYKFGLGQSPFPVPAIIVNELKKTCPSKRLFECIRIKKIKISGSSLPLEEKQIPIFWRERFNWTWIKRINFPNTIGIKL